MSIRAGARRTLARSPAGVALLVFLAAAALLLVLEHDAHLLGAWPLLLLLLVCLGMHLLVHRGHGPHGSRTSQDRSHHSAGGDDER